MREQRYLPLSRFEFSYFRGEIRVDESLGTRVIRSYGRNLGRVTVDQVYTHREHVDDYMSQLADCQPGQEATILISLGIS